MKACFIALVSMISMSVFAAPTQEPVQIRISPASPIVITADFTSGDLQVKAPWFMTQIEIANSSKEPITIVSVVAHIVAKDNHGKSVTQTTTVGPSDYNFTYVCANSTTIAVTYSDFGQFEPGTTRNLYGHYRGSLPVGCGELTDIDPIKLFFGNNPGEAQGVTDYKYHVALTLVGWYGTYDTPDRRFEHEQTVEFETN